MPARAVVEGIDDGRRQTGVGAKVVAPTPVAASAAVSVAAEEEEAEE
eukprot:gene38853-9317_t